MRIRRREATKPDEVSELEDRLGKTKARARRLRGQLDTSEARFERARTELAVLRAWTLDVFPEHPVPPELVSSFETIRDEGLTFLSMNQLSSLASCVLEVEASGRPGILIEAGTARGGSAIAMALAKSPERELWVHDVFGLIPAPGEGDDADVRQRYEVITSGRAKGKGGEVYYGYRPDLLGEVSDSFARHGVPLEENSVSLVAGLFQDTLIGDQPVALAHVDGDWYESTMTCLEQIAPRLVPGGRIVVDDYFAWSGCRNAVDAFIAAHPEYLVEWRAKVHIVRASPSD